MRYLLLLSVLAACEKEPTREPDTVVLVDDIWQRTRVELKPTAEPQDFWFGCKLAAVKDYAVIQCMERDLFVRFRCRDLAGPSRAIEFAVKGEAFRLYCR